MARGGEAVPAPAPSTDRGTAECTLPQGRVASPTLILGWGGGGRLTGFPQGRGPLTTHPGKPPCSQLCL